MYNVHTDALASLNSFTVLQCKVVESDMKKYILALSDQARLSNQYDTIPYDMTRHDTT